MRSGPPRVWACTAAMGTAATRASAPSDSLRCVVSFTVNLRALNGRRADGAGLLCAGSRHPATRVLRVEQVKRVAWRRLKRARARRRPVATSTVAWFSHWHFFGRFLLALRQRLGYLRSAELRVGKEFVSQC